MLSTITTLFGFVSDCFKVFEKRPIKFTIYLMIFLSILLVKPVVYYSTLYGKFADVSLMILIVFIIILIGCILLNKRKNKYYKNETVSLLLCICILLFCIICFGCFEQKIFFENYFANSDLNETELIQTVHTKAYFDALYSYVSMNIEIILFYCFEFIQMVSFTFLILYVLKKLFLSEESRMLDNYDLNVIVTNCFIIIATSPIFYENYSFFLNKIF